MRIYNPSNENGEPLATRNEVQTMLAPAALTGTVMDFTPESGDWYTPLGEDIVITGNGGEYTPNGSLTKQEGIGANATTMLDFPQGTNMLKFTYSPKPQHGSYFIRLARDPNTGKDVCLVVCGGTNYPYFLFNSKDVTSYNYTRDHRCNCVDLKNVITPAKFGLDTGTIGYDGGDKIVTITVEYFETHVRITSDNSSDECVVQLSSIRNMSGLDEHGDEIADKDTKMGHYKDSVITPGLGFAPGPLSAGSHLYDIQIAGGRSLRDRVEFVEHRDGGVIEAHGDQNVGANLDRQVLNVGVNAGSPAETVLGRMHPVSKGSVVSGTGADSQAYGITKIRIGDYYLKMLNGYDYITGIKIRFRQGYLEPGLYMQLSYDENFNGETYMPVKPLQAGGAGDITFDFVGVPAKPEPLYIRFFQNAEGTGEPVSAGYKFKMDRESGDQGDYATAMWNAGAWKTWIPFITIFATMNTDAAVPTTLLQDSFIKNNQRYSATMTDDTDFTSITMEQYARAELWLEHYYGTPLWPLNMVWSGGEPTWETNHKYFISLVYDRVRIVARVLESYEMPSNYFQYFLPNDELDYVMANAPGNDTEPNGDDDTSEITE